MPVQSRCDSRRPTAVIGPTGGLLRLDDLPPPNTRRWVVRRKAEVVAAVQGGLLDLHEALERYGLTEEEFNSWIAAFRRHGMTGLRSTVRPGRLFAVG